MCAHQNSMLYRLYHIYSISVGYEWIEMIVLPNDNISTDNIWCTIGETIRCITNGEQLAEKPKVKFEPRIQ